MLPLLDNLLQYKNKHVISRYQRDYPNSAMPAEQAFVEFMKFIWLNLKHHQDKALDPHNDNLNFSCVMHAEMLEIDNMWHTFLLFSKDYSDFCHQYLGFFFHHYPATDETDSSVDHETELSRYLSYVYDNFGETTLKTWFNEYFN